MHNYSAKRAAGGSAPGSEESMLEAALEYAGRGWPVFPTWGAIEEGGCMCPKGLDCTRAAKHPMTTKGFKDATTDQETIRDWWTRWPRANIGMPTGRRSGLLVVDVDSGKNGFENLAALIHCYGEWPDTPTVWTGGDGLHLFFQYPTDTEIRNDEGRKLGAGIDVRGEGGYVLLPPSVHATRRAYAWVEGEHG